MTLAVLVLLLSSPCVSADARAADDASAQGLEWSATINGRDVDEIEAGSALALRADQPLSITVTMTNPTDKNVRVDDVRLEGRVMGTAFFRFGAGIDVMLRPSAKPVERTVILRTTDLERQAVGSMPAELQLIGEDRLVLAKREFTVDVRGSLLSAYGVFGIGALVLTVAFLVSLLVAMLMGRLPLNRWVRAVRFAAPGLGVGLVLTFFLSVTRLLTPSAAVWLPLVCVCGAAAFLAGYLLPTASIEQGDRVPSSRAPLRLPFLPEQRRPLRLPRSLSVRRRGH
jgi:hypothetical protein